MSHLVMHKFLVEWQVFNTRQFKESHFLVKTVKSVFYYDQDKTFSPRDYLTPRIIAYPVRSVRIGDNRKRP